jgi:hypothetical protein
MAVASEVTGAPELGVCRPGHPGYDPARRLYNATTDKHPAVIVGCRNVSDVQHAIEFARTHGLLV